MSDKDNFNGVIAIAAMFGMVVIIFANGAHESIRCLGLILGFGVVFLAIAYGALRGA